MPDTSPTSNPDLERPSRLDPAPRKNLGKPSDVPDWTMFLWMSPSTLLLLWLWQDQLHQLLVKTIPYSQFKQYLADGEVKKCDVADEIPERSFPSARWTAAHPERIGVKIEHLQCGEGGRRKDPPNEEPAAPPKKEEAKS